MQGYFRSNHQATAKKNGYKGRYLKKKKDMISIHLSGVLFLPGCLDIYKCDSCFKIKKEGKCYQHMRECRKTCSGCEGEEISLTTITINAFHFYFFLRACFDRMHSTIV